MIFHYLFISFQAWFIFKPCLHTSEIRSRSTICFKQVELSALRHMLHPEGLRAQDTSTEQTHQIYLKEPLETTIKTRNEQNEIRCGSIV